MENSMFKITAEGAANYDKYLGPLLFEPFAKHISALLPVTNVNNILEIACGTGILTINIANKLAPATKFIATDFSAEMLEVAKQKLKKAPVELIVADVHDLPFKDNSFELIVCQFGLMFFPDKENALSEILRVLKPGGKFLFSTWDRTANSPLLKVVYDDVLLPYFLKEENNFYLPFSLYDIDKLDQLLSRNGFNNISINNVLLPAGKATLIDIMNGFFLKHLKLDKVKKEDPEAIPFITSEMEAQISQGIKNNKSFFNLSAIIGMGEK